MGHGFMGIGPTGLVFMAASSAFIAYLSRSFVGPEQPKFQVEPELVNLVKLYQPGIVPEHYYKKKAEN